MEITARPFLIGRNVTGYLDAEFSPNSSRPFRMKKLLLVVAALYALVATPVHAQSAAALLTASYDSARELFADINKAFVGQSPGKTVDQSHGGSSRQARAILEGLEADVVPFNQVTDIDA